MSLMASFKRNWPGVALALLCALVAYTALVAPTQIGRIELGREAQLATDRIGARLNGEPGTLIDAFARPGLTPRLGQIFDVSGYRHRVLRYELYDGKGNLTFTSGMAGLELEHEPAKDGVPASESKVTLHNRSDEAVSHFALITLPVQLSGEPNGRLLVYLDQSEQAKALSRYFGLIAAVTLLLLGAGVAAPIALTWMRSRERQQAEAQLRYLENHDPLTGLPNRKAFNEQLTRALAAMHSNQTQIAVALSRRRSSRRSTTRTATRPSAMRCCAKWAFASSPCWAPAILSPDGGATSLMLRWSASPLSAT